MSDLLVLVIEDNICNNYCNISLNNTYKWISSHMERGEENLQGVLHNLREQQKTLNHKKP